jgi:hypothetical protein
MSGSGKSVAAGITVAVLAALPIIRSMNSSKDDSVDTTQETVLVTTTTTPPHTTVVAVEPPEVAGVDDVVARVLYSSGAAEALTPGEVDELPPEVVRVLAYYGVTLTIATPQVGEAP